MKILSLLLVVVLAPAALLGERVDFSGYRVVSAVPGSEENAALLREMESADTLGIEFWSAAASPDANVTLSVHPDLVPVLEEFFQQKSIDHKVVAENLQVRWDLGTVKFSLFFFSLCFSSLVLCLFFHFKLKATSSRLLLTTR